MVLILLRTDAAARPFNGFIAQGIDMNWNLHTVPIAFDYIEGSYFKYIYIHISLLNNFFV
jgi:hypothetical protein